MLAAFEKTRGAGTPEVGSKVRGKIVILGEDTSFVDFGGRSEGAIETALLRNHAGEMTYQTGDEVDLFVVANEDQVLLAPSMRAEPSLALSQVQEARRTGMPITGQVTGVNSGGLEVDLAGIRAFCPVSQIEAGFCPDPSVHLNRSLEFLVTEIGEGGKRVVVSRRALLRRQEEDRARELLAGLRAGLEIDGSVARIEPFGAFVDLGGVDGLVHVSEIRHERTEHPGDVLKVGQSVRVRVLDVAQREGGRPRISLSIKAAQPDPWAEVAEQFWEGKRTTGTVARLADFGAFVNLAPGIDGLVHVSEIDLKPVKHPRDALSVGQVVEVKVNSVDPEKRRISLSIRDVLSVEQAAGDAGGGSAEDGARRGTGLTGSSPAAPPKAGDIADGWVASVKNYGVFVDLPAYGHRARGLVPHEETGERSGTDLTRRFRVGDPLKVEITEVGNDGRIRCSITRAQSRAQEAEFRSFQVENSASAGGNTAMAEALRRAMERKNR